MNGVHQNNTVVMTQETIIESKPTQQQQRVYIGGLNPARLTVADITKRLNNIPEIQVLNIDDGSSNQTQHSRTFLFVDVCLNVNHLCSLKSNSSSASSSSSPLSAYDILSSHYHNVKWKGCRLSVEMARPHFLQRLAQEQEQRLQTQNQTQEPINTNSNKTTKIPRQLRIRRKHGEEAIKVDTKPLQLNDFSHLSYYLQKVRKKELQTHKTNKSHSTKQESSPPKTSKRSLHLVFSHDANIALENNQITSSTVSTSDSYSEPDDQSFSSESHSSLESLNETTDETQQKSKTSQASAYVWSDSDSDSESESDADVKAETKPTQLETNHQVQRVDDNDTNDEYSQDDHSSNEADEMQQTEFVWSDDDNESHESSSASNHNEEEEENSDDDDDEQSIQSSQNSNEILKKELFDDENSDTATNEEIINESDSDMGQPNTTQYKTKKSKDSKEEFDLMTDVSSNLNILSQLFVNVSTKPTQIKSNTTPVGNMVTPSIHQGISLKMQRFDPTNMESLQKYQMVRNDKEIKKVKMEERSLNNENRLPNDLKNIENRETSEKDSKGDSENSVGSYDSISSKEDEQHKSRLAHASKENEALKEIDQETKVGEHYIYAQSKLENIFQEAHQEQQKTQFSMRQLFAANDLQAKEKSNDIIKEDSNDTDTNQGGGFSFSFHLGNKLDTFASLPNANPNLENFQDENNSKTNTENDAIDQTEEEHKQKQSIIPSYNFEIKRHKGFYFYKGILNDVVEDFYKINDKDAFRETYMDAGRLTLNETKEKEKEIWMEERRALTLDWKRKKKLSATRKGKKKKRRYDVN